MATAKKVINGKVRYAIVGAGWISQTALLPGVEHTGNSVVTTIVTGHDYKTEKLQEKYPTIAQGYSYEEYDQFLRDDVADAVYLATPNFDHVELAVKTLEAGLHLLLEKPMAVSVEECQRILAASKSTGAKLMIAYRLHFEPGMLKALERVRKRRTGNASLLQLILFAAGQRTEPPRQERLLGWAGAGHGTVSHQHRAHALRFGAH